MKKLTCLAFLTLLFGSYRVSNSDRRTVFHSLMSSLLRLRRVFKATVLAVVLLLGGCTKDSGVQKMQDFAVQVVALEAKSQSVVERLSLIGTLAANEKVEIKAENEGIVQKILFREGQKVEEGQLLICLDDSKLAASLAEARANFQLGKANFERAQHLYKEKLIPQQEFDQATSVFAVTEASVHLKERQLRDARILAPFAGIVGVRNVSPGQVIDKNTTLGWLVDLDPIKVEFHAPERFAGQIRAGLTIECLVAAYPGEWFKGEVFFISPEVDLDKRTILLKAQMPNPHHQLKPGMFAKLDLILKRREDSVIIPEAAVHQLLENDWAHIFTVDGSLAAQLRKVKIGVWLLGWVEVTEGLKVGEMVVVEGTHKIGPGMSVKLAPKEASRPYESSNEFTVLTGARKGSRKASQ